MAVLLRQQYASTGCKGENSHQLLASLILLLLRNKLLTLSCINAIDSIQKSDRKEYLTSTVITLDSEISVLAPSKSQLWKSLEPNSKSGKKQVDLCHLVSILKTVTQTLNQLQKIKKHLVKINLKLLPLSESRY